MQQHKAQKKQAAWLWWSSGKDSAWALHVLCARDDLEVCGLVTTYNRKYDRVTMHGVRRELVHRQARALNLPLHEMDLPVGCDNETYERSFGIMVERAREAGVDTMAFGDLLLADVRAYRESLLRENTIEPLFPIWGEPTDTLARRMIDAGLEAIVVCVDPSRLPADFAGRVFDHCFLDELPDGVDPCGENGEFHTLVYAGPVFPSPLPVLTGDTVERGGFVFTDVVPAA